jgi:plasmid replication initiation protein
MELSRITDDKQLKIHNTITSGRTDYSACQLDVLFMLLACINDSDKDLKRYNIRVKDIELITGRKWNYQQVVESNEDMMSRVYRVEEPDGLKQIVLFSEVKYLEGTGSFDMVINPAARPYFYELKNNYTLLELKSVLSCTSKHAKRIYSLCCQWKSAGGHRFDLGDFKEMLGLKDPKGKEAEQYVDASMFRTKVLDIAKKQINENTDITFDYELKKMRGRKFDTIVMYCGFSKPTLIQTEIDFKQDLEKQKSNAELIRKIDAIKAVGIRDDLAELWAVKYWKQYVEEKNKMLEEIQKGKEIKDFPAYLAGVFKKKGFI